MSCRTGQCDNMPKKGCARINYFSSDMVSSPYGPIGNAQNNCAGQINKVAQMAADLRTASAATPAPVAVTTAAPVVVPATKPPTRPATLPPVTPAPFTSPPVSNVTCGDGLCSPGESCDTCPADCARGTFAYAVCGNGVCEAADGETMMTCPYDCRTDRTGVFKLECGLNGACPTGCNEGRFVCTTFSAGTMDSCCGDGACTQGENARVCAVDCA
jgi:hypothetical protein